MRIRSRLTLWYTGLLAVIFLILGGAAYGLLEYTLLRETDAALQGVAQALAEKSKEGRGSVLPPEVDEIFRHFFGFSPMDRYFERQDPFRRPAPQAELPGSGKLPLSPRALKNASRGLPTYETIEGLGPYPVRVLTWPIVAGGRLINLIQVGMSQENFFRTRRNFLLVMAAVFPIALILAGGGGWILARRALRPVDEIVETTHRISAEHLGGRLKETGSGDELDKLTRTLNEMLARLEAAFGEMRRFSADASHELQTPLTILKGEMEVALRNPRSQEEYQRILKSSLEEIDRISHLVGGLLLLARSDAGVLRRESRRLDLVRLIQEVYEQAKALAQKRGVDLLLGEMEPLSVQGDYELLKRLFFNLLDNGIKYTPGGGKVTASLRRNGEWIDVKVSDTGIGISAEEQGEIFQRFYRAAEARSRAEGGAGLGLCIVRSIAEAHGGRVEVESSPGQGSTFTVLLPAAE